MLLGPKLGFPRLIRNPSMPEHSLRFGSVGQPRATAPKLGSAGLIMARESGGMCTLPAVGSAMHSNLAYMRAVIGTLPSIQRHSRRCSRAQHASRSTYGKVGKASPHYRRPDACLPYPHSRDAATIPEPSLDSKVHWIACAPPASVGRSRCISVRPPARRF